MSEDCGGPPVKEIKDPIIDALQPDPQFIDPVPEKVGFWTAQRVTLLRQPLNSDPAFVLSPGRKPIELL